MTLSRRDVALLALRLVLGAALVGHGYPKLMHLTYLSRHVVPGSATWLGVAGAIVEFFGGIALVLGIVTQIAAFLAAADMVIAIFFFLIPHGAVFVSPSADVLTFELPLAYCTIAFALLLEGAGSVSLDALRGTRQRRRHGDRGARRHPL